MNKTHSITLLSIASLMIAGGASLTAEDSTPQKNPWSFTQIGSIGYSYDDNVYLQDVTDQASKGSAISKLGIKLGSSYDSDGSFKLAAAYSGSFNWYDSEPSEDHSTHVGTLKISGLHNESPWKSANKIVLIDGNETGPTFTGPGGAPAAGGVPIRNRRDAFIYIGSASIEQSIGKWFVRPLMNAYIHDFDTIHKSSPGYLNYVDRNDFSGGVDIGSKKTWEDHTVYLGFRYGHQTQKTLLNSPLQYSNDYRRILIGISGKPKGWLKYDFEGGPDYRSFNSNVASGFDRNSSNLYFKSSLSLMPTEHDSIKITGKQYIQPSYGGRSAYQDKLYTITWKHTKDDLSYSAGFRTYNAKWPAPFKRNDWIYTFNGVVSYKIDDTWRAEASYSYDFSESRIENTSGREFTRNLVNIGLRYSFK